MKFWTDTEYHDERGAIIIRRSLTDTETCSQIQYFGRGMIKVPTQFGEVPTEFDAPIEAETIEQAFEVFEDQMEANAPAAAEAAAQKVLDQVQRQVEAQSNSIVTPDQMRNAAQFDPNIRG